MATKMFKQVIVMRDDLNMGRGKMVAQGAHASAACLATSLVSLAQEYHAKVPYDVIEWIENGQTKICVRVGSEAELMEIAEKAVAAKLVCHVITDAGLTEFGGVPTRTCVAVGPNEVQAVDEITGRLRLL
ncbi:MAG: aminoacyl-tRNA hydrolase [Acidobacteria bacterium]|nr:aminoacyl-tRNA hydrolase [Acidobacteriota bacterium]